MSHMEPKTKKVLFTYHSLWLGGLVSECERKGCGFQSQSSIQLFSSYRKLKLKKQQQKISLFLKLKYSCAFFSSRSKIKMEKCVDVTCANDIYPIIGDGIYQIIIIGVICLLMIPSGIPQFVMIFLSQTPEWVFVGVRNNSSSQNDICKLNKSDWKWTRPVDYSIVSEVKYLSLCCISKIFKRVFPGF